MGDIKRILLTGNVPAPSLNTRFVVELSENVHIHYRNLRIEMDKDEFLLLLAAMKKIDEGTVSSFAYGPDAFLALAGATLPEATPFNGRLRVEEQRNGTIHIHYRNLRLES